MVFGEETAKATASAAVVSGIWVVRVQMSGGNRRWLRAVVKYVVYVYYCVNIFRDLAARLCRRGGEGVGASEKRRNKKWKEGNIIV